MTLFDLYMDYIGESEAPTIFHRWSYYSMISAILSRNVHIPFGHSCIYPNQYIMLMGSPGTRKGTAINPAKHLATLAGYQAFSKNRTSLERFLIDMKAKDPELDLSGSFETDLMNLSLDSIDETWACIGEFVDFTGQNNMDFIILLTNLWDNLPKYEHPKIQGKSVLVHKPTINILGGSTAQNWNLACPPEAGGSGFLSRLIFIHSEPTGSQITFPPTPSKEKEELLVSILKEIMKLRGEVTIHPDARSLCDRLYKEAIHVTDPRFTYYSTRRFTHLLKLATVVAASDLRTEIIASDLVMANTALAQAEKFMPKALGEFGNSRYSHVSNIIMEALNRSFKPIAHNDLWRIVCNDLNKQGELMDVMNNLRSAGKVRVAAIAGKEGYLPVNKVANSWKEGLVDFNLLRNEERTE